MTLHFVKDTHVSFWSPCFMYRKKNTEKKLLKGISFFYWSALVQKWYFHILLVVALVVTKNHVTQLQKYFKNKCTCMVRLIGRSSVNWHFFTISFSFHTLLSIKLTSKKIVNYSIYRSTVCFHFSMLNKIHIMYSVKQKKIHKVMIVNHVIMIVCCWTASMDVFVIKHYYCVPPCVSVLNFLLIKFSLSLSELYDATMVGKCLKLFYI